MTSIYSFKSIIGNAILEYLDYNRALGKNYSSEQEYLAKFDRYLISLAVNKAESITPAVLNNFLKQTRYTPRVYNARINLLKHFFDWLILQNRLSINPINVPKQPNHQPMKPFIFTLDQVRQLFKLAAELPPHYRLLHRGETYHLAFALMYCLGLRVGEVARLFRKDTDLTQRIMTIRETKFSKSRQIPFGPKLGNAIEAYMSLNDSVCSNLGANDPLLSYHHDKKLPIKNNGRSISHCFHKLIPTLGLSVPEGVQYPRAHHLRHSFAVATLLRWYREGINPATRLIHLTTFMGHVDPCSTAVYLTITAELLQQANDRFEEFATSK